MVVGPLAAAGEDLLEQGDADPDRPMMTVNAISPSQVRQDDDCGIMSREAVEAWFKAVAGT